MFSGCTLCFLFFSLFWFCNANDKKNTVTRLIQVVVSVTDVFFNVYIHWHWYKDRMWNVVLCISTCAYDRTCIVRMLRWKDAKREKKKHSKTTTIAQKLFLLCIVLRYDNYLTVCLIYILYLYVISRSPNHLHLGIRKTFEQN